MSQSVPFKIFFAFIVFVAIMPLVAGFGSIVRAPIEWKTWFGISGLSILWVLVTFWNYQNNREVVFSKLFIPMLVFVLWVGISSFWSINSQVALTTVVQFFSYLVAFALSITLLTNKERVLLVFKSLMLTLFVVVSLGLLQYYLADNQWIQELYFQTGTVGSVFGNRNMAVQFVIMLVPMVIALFLLENRSRNVYLYSAVLFLTLLFLINSTARQGYVALIIETFALLTFFAVDYYKNRAQSLVGKTPNIKHKSIILLFILLMLGVVSNFNIASKSNKIDHFVSIAQGADNSRIPVWINTIELIKDNPVIGVGAGQWKEHYPLYYNRAAFDKAHGEKVKFRDAHNDYLETFANYGLVGILILAWLVYIIIVNFFKVLINPNNTSRMLILSIALSFIGLSVVALVSFPINWYVPGFFVAIFLGILSRLSGSILLTHQYKRLNSSLLVLSFVVLILSSYYVFNTYRGEYYYYSAFRSYIGDHPDQAIPKIKKAISHKKSGEYYTKAGEYLLGVDMPEESIVYLLKGKEQHLFRVPLLFNLAEAYRVTKSFDQEEEILKYILNNDPKNVIASARLVKNLVTRDRYDDANPFYIKMKYNFDYFKDISAYGPYHANVAEVALLVGDYKYFAYVYDDLISRSPEPEDFVVYGIIEYQRVGNKPKAKKLLKKALELSPAVKTKIPDSILDDLQL